MLSSTFRDSAINLMGYTVEKSLGGGAFGTVYLVALTSNPAVKKALKKIPCRTADQAIKAREEADTLSRTNHRNILSYDKLFQSGSYAYIVTEYCPNGNLNQYLGKGLVSWDRRWTWYVELVNALEYLHDKQIAHRDLKPDNILLTAALAIKVADFGLAKRFESIGVGGFTPPQDLKDAGHSMSRYMSTWAGTSLFMAPEVWSGKYKKAADIFALGIIFITIAERPSTPVTESGKTRYYYAATVNNCKGQTSGIGYAMWSDSSENPNYLLKKYVDDGVGFWSATYTEMLIIRSMLHPNYHQRPSIAAVRKYVKATKDEGQGYVSFFYENIVSRVRHLIL